MSTTATHDWKGESAIKQQEHADGYQQESAAESENPTERDANTEGAVEDLQHTHSQSAASATTLYADDDEYDGNRVLPECERWNTKRDKFARLWKLNAGHDDWRAGRKSREECHKVNENKELKKRLTEAVCNQADLSTVASERATALVSRDCPPQMNFLGNTLTLWILACVVVAAEEHGEDAKLAHVTPREFFKRPVSPENLAEAVEYVNDYKD